jgi:hypothetical protein
MGMTAKTISKVALAAGVAIVAYLLVGAIFAHADAAPQITTTIRNGSETIITSANVGTSVHDVVQVASTTSQAVPQGTVDFNVYANTSCSGTAALVQSGVALVNGFATSTATTTGATGLSYKVHYNGDNANIAADGPCESLTALSNTVSITTALSAGTITAGANAHDSATLSGATSNAGGSVTYTVYSDSNCQTPFGGGGNVSVSNGSVPNSNGVVFPNAGTFYWQAVYHGDANNSAATSTCGSEILTVQAVQGKNSPTISTTLSNSAITVGGSVHDSATLSGAAAGAVGSVTYKVFSDNACNTLFGNAGSQTVANSIVPDSAPFQFNSAGTYYWQAIYGGDANNNAATSTCASEVVTVANPGTTGTGNGTLSGQVFNDKNDNGVMDSGEEGLAGFKIHLYNSANFNGGAYFPIFQTAVTDSNGNYSFSGLANGTYSVEQVLKKGWKQTSDDYASVSVSGGSGQSGLNFGDKSGGNGKERGHGTEKDHHKNRGKDNDQDDTDDNTASSTHSWFRFEGHDNGLHIGWTIGKGNHSKDHGKDKGKDD